MTRYGADAVAWMEYQRSRRIWWREGLCLKAVRSSFDVPSMQNAVPAGGYALLAWQRADNKHTGDRTWPVGVPGYFDQLGFYGHIVTLDRDGYCYSTDYPRTNYIGRAKVTDIERNWGCRFLGWSEDLNEVRVYQQKEWDEMASREEVREVMDNALAAFVDSAGFKNAVRLAIEAERGEVAQAVVDKAANALAADTDFRTRFRANVRVPVDAELTQRNLGT